MQHGTVLPARQKLTIVAIATISEYFARDSEVRRRARTFEFRAGNGEKDKLRIDDLGCARDRLRDLALLGGDIAQGAVRLHMRDLVARISGERLRCADLIGNEPLDFRRRKWQPPPAETP